MSLQSSTSGGSGLRWGRCPDCGDPLTVRYGEHGRFMGCLGFPSCDYSRGLDRAERNILNGRGYLDREDDADADGDQGGASS